MKSSTCNVNVNNEVAMCKIAQPFGYPVTLLWSPFSNRLFFLLIWDGKSLTSCSGSSFHCLTGRLYSFLWSTIVGCCSSMWGPTDVIDTDCRDSSIVCKACTTGSRTFKGARQPQIHYSAGFLRVVQPGLLTLAWQKRVLKSGATTTYMQTSALGVSLPLVLPQNLFLSVSYLGKCQFDIRMWTDKQLKRYQTNPRLNLLQPSVKIWIAECRFVIGIFWCSVEFKDLKCVVQIRSLCAWVVSSSCGK